MSHKWMIDVLADLCVTARKDGKETAATFLKRAMHELQSEHETSEAVGDVIYEKLTQNGRDYRGSRSSNII